MGGNAILGNVDQVKVFLLHAWLVKDMHVVSSDPLKLNIAINTCLNNLNNFVFYFSLNICESSQ